MIDAVTDPHEAPAPAPNVAAVAIAAMRRFLRTSIGRLLAATAISLVGLVLLYAYVELFRSYEFVGLILLLLPGAIVGFLIGGWAGVAGLVMVHTAITVYTILASHSFQTMGWNSFVVWIIVASHLLVVGAALVGFWLGVRTRRLWDRRRRP